MSNPTLIWELVRHRPSERRRSVRNKVTDSLAIKVAGGVSYRGFSRDASVAGIGVIVCATLAIGETVSVVCQVPDGKELLRLPAIVRNRWGSRYGLEFLNVNAEQDRAIREWIKSER
jgi:c-di-GMP-binding flagellar brake protein YcgR